MAFEYCERGSEWRKWDLHVHTPSSLFHNYKEKDGGDVWESFIKDLESLPAEFKVLGINDYLFIDGYKKVLEYKQQGRLQNIDLILPVIELRIAKFCGNEKFKRINYHIIFSNEVSPEIIQHQFLNGLSTSYKLDVECGQKEWGGVINKKNLEELGKKIKASVPETEISKYGPDLIEGFNNLNLEISKISKTLENAEQYFKGNYVTCIGKTEWDDFKWDDNSIAEKKTIINSVDLVFTASESIEKYISGKNKLKKSGVNNLLLDCSDAHHNIDSNNKDRIGNCNTWIKADTTFEGLKQIIYEPEERLKIQETKPDYKYSYEVIDSIIFQNENFQKNKIKLNSNLVSIIGSRSSGKSTLLRSVANAIDKDQSTKNCGNEWENLINPNISVKWANNDHDKYHKNEEYDNNGKKIIYIPQNFLSLQTLTEKPSSFAHKTIQDILKKNNQYKYILDSIENETNLYKSNITKEVDELFSIELKIQDIQKNISELGNVEIITDEIKKLGEKYTSIQSSEQINEKDKELQIELTEEIQKINDSIKMNRLEYNILNNLNNNLDIDIYNLDELNLNKLNSELYDDLTKEISIAKQTFKRIVKDKIEENILIIEYSYEKLTSDLKSINTHLDTINNKIKLSETGQIIFEHLNYEKNKLKDLKSKKSDLIAMQKTFSVKLEKIYNLSKNFLEKLNNFKNEFKFSDENNIFKAEVIFKRKDFGDDAFDMLDIRKLRPFEEANNINIENFRSDLKYTEDLFKVIHNILNDNLSLKNKFNKRNAIIGLLNPYHFIRFNIIDENDTLETMSPGKRSFALLKVLIKLDDSGWPILLDQPEDDLDANSISNELSKFLRDTKKERQIIIVSHNPNLVIGADSEQIIVANQHGNDAKNMSKRFEFVSGSIENTYADEDEDYYLYIKGIKEHVCHILEGGEESFKKRQSKYNII